MVEPPKREHFAKPTTQDTGKTSGPFQQVSLPICVVCGEPIHRPQPRAAQGAWRHGEKPAKKKR